MHLAVKYEYCMFTVFAKIKLRQLKQVCREPLNSQLVA